MDTIYLIERYSVTDENAPIGTHSVVAACSSMKSVFEKFKELTDDIIKEYDEYVIDTDTKDHFVITADEEEWTNWDELKISPIELEE